MKVEVVTKHNRRLTVTTSADHSAGFLLVENTLGPGQISSVLTKDEARQIATALLDYALGHKS